jgi:hypothetical protein
MRLKSKGYVDGALLRTMMHTALQSILEEEWI